MAGNTRAHVFVSGTVQGVYYRASTRDAARERGVDGWVRNRDDGRVEAVFEGEEGAVESMVEWCHMGATPPRSNALWSSTTIPRASPASRSGDDTHRGSSRVVSLLTSPPVRLASSRQCAGFLVSTVVTSVRRYSPTTCHAMESIAVGGSVGAIASNDDGAEPRSGGGAVPMVDDRRHALRLLRHRQRSRRRAPRCRWTILRRRDSYCWTEVIEYQALVNRRKADGYSLLVST